MPAAPTTLAPSAVVRATDDPTAAALIAAAVETMAAKGYHGTSVRDIASAAGVSVGSLYNYFGSKHDLLALILDRGLDDLVTATEDALLRAGTDPADRLRAIVGVHVGRHTAAPRESLLGNSELRSLTPHARAVVVTKRDVQQRMFDRVVADGARRGAFTTPTPVDAARFVVSACTAVATWYRADGPLGADEVTARYQEIALAAVGYLGAR
ncbi:TetR/AcrR family transcriptional regulator [Rhodococcus sp. HNM0569]|uniref:TetR/AcrR family transcriptional regulator n=1 Tax=Rhodococcus sp. HNM0569 TaxID=2716340 RepID=UPI00146DEC77|nr:TetR/AcrR family transcriptional regulator [Rhodococcus sp. HNM0569]NLU83596.1 TetR/AcrR family transcriptional regulator [Rhodococcus sp. HNM0569]